MKNNFKSFYLVIFAVLALIFYISAKYFNFFETNPPLTREEWGQLGDYFGGTLNPILGFASFLALLATIIYQVKELNLSRTELELTRQELSKSAAALTSQNKAIELQSFEQTFFSWLNTYKDLLLSTKGNIKTLQNLNGAKLEGREFLYELWNQNLSVDQLAKRVFQSDAYGQLTNELHTDLDFKTTLTDEMACIAYDKKLELLSKENGSSILQLIQTQWLNTYRNNEYKLDSLFRTAYKLITWIDAQQSERLNNAQKWLYISIFRSQLSWVEMVYLYYNGLTKRGSKFKLLIEKYALFDNLTIESDIVIKISNEYLPLEFNYMAEAFSSELAREKLGLPRSSEETLALASTTSQQA